MHVWSEMQSYVGFDADVDGPRLRAFAQVAGPRLDGVVDHFYETLARFAGARAVLDGPEQIERLKKTLRVWVRELLAGPWDDIYFARRQHIGRVHVRVGLPDRYMFTAMNQVRDQLVQIAFETSSEPRALVQSIGRVCDLDLAAMTHTYMDVSQKARVRELQQLILHSLPVTVVCLDDQDRVTASTRRGSRLVEEPTNDVLPHGLSEKAKLGKLVADSRVTGEEQGVDVVLGRGPDARHFHVTVIHLGHVQADVCIHVEEQTTVVHAQRQLAHAQSLAQIGALAANLAHEIRNPLAAISSTLQVIGGSFGVDDRRRAVVAKLGGQVERLNSLVTDLLGFARDASADLVEYPLRSLVRDAVAQSDVDAEVVGEECRVLLDPDFTIRILLNLIQNARDAGGPVRIEVGDHWVRVVDSGAGVPATMRARIFEPFITTKQRGTGLGLAICTKLATAMQAGLTLEDTPKGSGASFLLSFEG
ncbi:MAG: hypothetical protein GY913_06580 [Proteobacteria bacterium]|nr:hypothetical protein [Pseudomonadota bacterium]MCP4916571.1 hypothetical protein [Pseudomonadota bacterium]